MAIPINQLVSLSSPEAAVPPSPTIDVVSNVPAIEMGQDRDLNIIKEGSSINGEPRRFALEKQTETRFAGIVQKYFTATYGLTEADGLEAWQVQFNETFKKRIEEAAENKPYAEIPTTLRNQLIETEAARFIENTANLQAAEKIDQYTIAVLQRRLAIKIGFLQRATPDEVHGVIGKIADPQGGEAHDDIPSGFADKLLRRIAGGATPIEPKRLNAHLARPIVVERHMSLLERARYTFGKSEREQAEKRSKQVQFKVEYVDQDILHMDLAGMSAAEEALLHTYGVDTTTDTLNKTTAGEVLNTVREASEARGDFYARTGFDVSKLQINFIAGIADQPVHTRLERKARENLIAANGNGNVDSNELRKEVGRLSVDAIEQATITRLDDELRLARSANEVKDIIAIRDSLGEDKPEADVAERRKELTAQQEIEDEALVAAQARETLIEERVKIEKELGVLDTKLSPEIVAAYDAWLELDSALEAALEAAEDSVAHYQGAHNAIKTLRDELKDMRSAIATIKTANQNNQNNRRQQQNPEQDIPDAPETPEQARMKGMLDRESEAQDRLDSLLAEGIKDEQGAIINEIQLEQALEKAKLQKTRAEAKKEKRVLPTNITKEMQTQLEERRAKLAAVAGLTRQIEAGSQDSVATVKKRIDALKVQIENLQKPDKFDLARQEVLTTYIDLVLDKDARQALDGRLLLLRENKLPLQNPAFSENYPKAYVRALQIVFGDMVGRKPDMFDRATRVLPPWKFREIFNRSHNNSITDDDSFFEIEWQSINNQDIQDILSTLRKEAQSTSEDSALGYVKESERRVIEETGKVEANPQAPAPDPARIQRYEEAFYYYRDVADLRLRLLADWAEQATGDWEAYFDTSRQANVILIQTANQYATAIDALRRRKRSSMYGNAVTNSTPLSLAA